MWSLERIISALLSDTCDLSEVIFLGVAEQGVHRVHAYLRVFFGKEYEMFFKHSRYLTLIHTSDAPELDFGGPSRA